MTIFRQAQLTGFLIILFTFPVISQVYEEASSEDARANQARGVSMLDDIKKLIKQRYYDQKFHGIDLDERFKLAKERVRKMSTNYQIFRVIAQVLIEFEDSHTRFVPPNRADQIEYGFSTQMVGEDCYIATVKTGSDAEKKGLRPGDKVIEIGKYGPTRANLWKINYLLYSLDPQPIINVTVLTLNGTERTLEIKAAFKSIKDRQKEADRRRNKKRADPYRCQPVNSETIACKLETFSVDKKFIDKMIKDIEGYKKLILDLRGNGGGLVSIEEYLVGHFFDHDLKIATFVARDKSKDRTAKTQGGKVFKGDVIVLVDSNSGSASEVFARVIQLEKRGRIVGDTSAGAVMTSNFIVMQNESGTPSFQTVSLFAINLTVADLIMSDGKRLEKVGVIPDDRVLPSGKELAEKMDPVLAHAAKLLGANLSAQDAGNFHFLVLKTEDDDDDSGDGDK